jgi:hypothetical protein
MSLKAELNTYESFALRHCHQQENPPMLCAEVKDDVDRLRAQLSKLSSSGVSMASWWALFFGVRRWEARSIFILV